MQNTLIEAAIDSRNNEIEIEMQGTTEEIILKQKVNRKRKSRFWMKHQR